MHEFLKPKKVSASNSPGATSDDILEETQDTLKTHHDTVTGHVELMNSGRISIL